MPLRTYPGRLLVSTAISSVVALLVSSTVAVLLYRDQSRTAEVLSEDIGSRGAAINLEVTLSNLIALHNGKATAVSPLQDQVNHDLAGIERFADKDTERELVARVRASVEEYLKMWRAQAPPEELAEYLRTQTVVAARALLAFNGKELRNSEEDHSRALRRMAWGLAAVGVLGSIAGLVFGYGLARSLRRSIQQFLVQVRGASELLGQQFPEVEVAKGREPLREGAEDLLRRVEQAVRKLNEQEREVRRSERLAAVGQLAAGVAHEIRNPLTSATLLLEVARKDPTSGGLTEEDLDLIEQELKRIEQTLQRFLDFARPPKLQRAGCDFSAIVREALALTRGRIEQNGIKVDLEVPRPPCLLTADAGQLRQVVLNLILNAADFMAAGGRLMLRVTADGGGVEFVVADTGPGISADILPRLFQPFATGKETGTGLGLVISKRIVEDHGGTIRGENTPEGGARFTVRLPFDAPNVTG